MHPLMGSRSLTVELYWEGKKKSKPKKLTFDSLSPLFIPLNSAQKPAELRGWATHFPRPAPL